MSKFTESYFQITIQKLSNQIKSFESNQIADHDLIWYQIRSVIWFDLIRSTILPGLNFWELFSIVKLTLATWFEILRIRFENFKDDSKWFESRFENFVIWFDSMAKFWQVPWFENSESNQIIRDLIRNFRIWFGCYPAKLWSFYLNTMIILSKHFILIFEIFYRVQWFLIASCTTPKNQRW